MQRWAVDRGLPKCVCGGDPHLHMEGPHSWVACTNHPKKHVTGVLVAPSVDVLCEMWLALQRRLEAKDRPEESA